MQLLLSPQSIVVTGESWEGKQGDYAMD